MQQAARSTRLPCSAPLVPALCAPHRVDEDVCGAVARRRLLHCPCCCLAMSWVFNNKLYKPIRQKQAQHRVQAKEPGGGEGGGEGRGQGEAKRKRRQKNTLITVNGAFERAAVCLLCQCVCECVFAVCACLCVFVCVCTKAAK